MIATCICKNHYQDQVYGTNNRVHNPMVKENKVIGLRCTSCGKETKK